MTNPAQRHELSHDQMQGLSDKLLDFSQQLPPEQQTALKGILLLAKKQVLESTGKGAAVVRGQAGEVQLGDPDSFNASFAEAFDKFAPGAFRAGDSAGRAQLAGGTICIE